MDQQNQQNPYPPQNGQQYQQQPQPQIIYVQQTVQPRRREREPIPDCMRPSSGLGVAIVAMVMFTLPFGIVSLLRAVKVDKYWEAGMRYEAIDQARSAKRWGVWGIILGAILWFVMFVAITEAIEESNEYYYEDYYDYDDYDDYDDDYYYYY
ncbi:MAG: CD225/dispanin family protein [Alistipes sp.]|nr:CD225/dispanin family protein [Alistipes sp.]